MTLHITDSWKSNSAMKKQWGCWFKICFNEGSREAWHAAVHGVANSRTRLSNWTAEALLLLSRFSRVRLCGTPETAAHQAPPSLGFSRQEHWSGLPFPSPAKALVEMKSSTALERKKKKKIMRLTDRAENYWACGTATMTLFSHWTAPTTKLHLAGPVKSLTAEACPKNRCVRF